MLKRLRAFHEKPSKHLTLFFPGTVNNQKEKTIKRLKL